MKTTEWFPGDVKPVREGLYQVLVNWSAGRGTEWAYWTGKGWGWGYPNKRDALSPRWKTTNGATQNKRWRGLTTKGGK